jgi:hypothetical protein
MLELAGCWGNFYKQLSIRCDKLTTQSDKLTTQTNLVNVKIRSGSWILHSRSIALS